MKCEACIALSFIKLHLNIDLTCNFIIQTHNFLLDISNWCACSDFIETLKYIVLHLVLLNYMSKNFDLTCNDHPKSQFLIRYPISVHVVSSLKPLNIIVCSFDIVHS